MPADLRFASLHSYELLPDREELVTPQPLRTTLLALTPTLAVAALWASGVASAGVATVAGGVLLVLAVVRGGYAWSDARHCRVLADRLLRAHASRRRSPTGARRSSPRSARVSVSSNGCRA